MTVKRNITVIVPDELVYALDPDCEYVFVLSREKGRIVARPTMEAIPECHSYYPGENRSRDPMEKCMNCRFYDSETDVCSYGV